MKNKFSHIESSLSDTILLSAFNFYLVGTLSSGIGSIINIFILSVSKNINNIINLHSRFSIAATPQKHARTIDKANYLYDEIYLASPAKGYISIDSERHTAKADT